MLPYTLCSSVPSIAKQSAWCMNSTADPYACLSLCCLAGKGASSGVGFAIPIDTVKGLVDQILTYGRVMRPSLGVVIAPQQVLQNVSGIAKFDRCCKIDRLCIVQHSIIQHMWIRLFTVFSICFHSVHI